MISPVARPEPHRDSLAEVEENVRVLVEAEMEAQHELLPHQPPVPECPTCRRHAATSSAPGHRASRESASRS